MKNWFKSLLAAAFLLAAPVAHAADSNVVSLTAAASVVGTDLWYCGQSVGTVDKKCSSAQIAAYVYGLMSGDATASGAGALTLKNTGPGATGPIGSATVAPIVTIDAQGRVTALSSASITQPAGANPSATAGPAANNGVATTFMRSDASPAVQQGSNAQKGIVQVDGTTISASAGVISAVNTGTVTSVTPGGGNVSSVTASCSQSAITATGTISSAQCVNAQVGTTYTFVDGDRAKLVTFSNAASVAVTLPQAGAASAFQNGWFIDVVNKGVGTVTITPTTSTINGTTTLVLTTNQGSRIFSDGTNYQINSGSGSGGSGISSITPGAALVSGVTASCTQTAITTSGTLSAAECLNAQVGTSYAIADSDRGKLVTGTNASGQAYSIAQAGTASAFANGWFTRVQNKGTGVLVITPTTSTINGAASLSVFPGQTVKITSDGANYQASTESPTAVAATDQTGANYAFKSSDYGGVVYLSNASNQVPTIPQAGTTGFPAGWYVTACNIGAGTQTITPTTSTIGGASTKVLRAASATAPACSTMISDGVNYRLVDDAQAAIGTSGATLPLLNGTNTWSGVQTFGQTIGAVSTQSGTTYTLANTDCGSTVRFTNASAVTVTIPQGLTVGCVIAIEQAAAGAVSVNGSAVTPATLHSAHSYTKTSAQWAVIGIFTESSNVAVLTGDGA